MSDFSNSMKQAGLTQAEVAERAGVSQGYISQIASGTKTPKPELAVKLQGITGYPAEAWHPYLSALRQQSDKSQAA